MNGYAAAYVTINNSSPIPPQSSYFTYYSNPGHPLEAFMLGLILITVVQTLA